MMSSEVGALLLQRTTRTLALTEAGEDFYESVVRVLDETESAVERLRERGGRPTGLLRVSVPTSFALLAAHQVLVYATGGKGNRWPSSPRGGNSRWRSPVVSRWTTA